MDLRPPFDLDDWRALIARFSLYDTRRFAGWLPILRMLESTPIYTPRELRGIRDSDIRRLVDFRYHLPLAISLWKAAPLSPQPTTEEESPFPLPLKTSDSLAARAFRVKDIEHSAPANRRRDAISNSELRANFDTAGPVAKITAFDLTSGDPSEIDSFLDSGFAVNLTR